jgi:hypothetical protein
MGTSLRLVAVVFALTPAFAGDGPDQNAAQTAFDPRKHGFGFTNYFEGDVLIEVPFIGQVDVGDSTYGLCGGMTFASFDTFAAHGAAPPDVDPPEPGTPLRSYVYGRQRDTFEAHGGFLVKRLLAWSWRPIESTWLWTGLHELSKGQFFDVVAPAIEAKKPVPLCVIASDIDDYLPTDALSSDGFLENHQVLAIGFRRCAATSGANAHWGVDVYDPNHPGITCTLHLLPDRGVVTKKTLGNGSPLFHVDDPTKNVVGEFRGFFAVPYEAKVPFWVGDAPLLASLVAKMHLETVAFGDEDERSPSGLVRAPKPLLTDLIADRTAQLADLRARIATLEAQLAAQTTEAKAPPKGKTPKVLGGKTRYLRSSLMGWFGLIWAVVGTAFLIVGGSVLVAADTTRATDVEGVVVEKGRDEDHDGVARHWLRYTWRDAEGGEHAGLIETDEDAWSTRQPGDAVSIERSTADPSRATLAGEPPPLWLFASIGLVFAGVGWALVIAAFRASRRRAHLIANGVATDGTVERVEIASNVRINGRNPRYLLFEFHDEVGERRSGRSPLLPRALEERWRDGDRIRVVYDPLDRALCEADIFDARAT